MAKAYYGNKLSPNISKTVEGFLICKNVPIARTGTQQYLGREIGIDDKYDDIITVYRTEEEVFNPRVFASFEGKPLTDEHPSDWVVPGNVQTYLKGIIRDVRRGEGKDRDLLLADILVYDPIAIEEIQTKQKREVSCGYECEYIPYKDGYMQKHIIGNHVALVSAGRAGDRVAIKDNAMKNKTIVNERRSTKMRLPRKGGASDFMKALGLKTFAMDAEPDEVMEAVDEMANEKFEEKIQEQDVAPVVAAVGGALAQKALGNDEDVIEEEKKATDEELEEVKNSLSEVKDALYSLLTRDEDLEEKEMDDEGLEKLDELIEEEEETKADDYDEVEEIESIESPVEDEDVLEEENMTADDIKELAKVLKPIIASIPDSDRRKKVSDNLADVLKKHKNKAVRDSKSNIYSDLAGRTKTRTVRDNAPIDAGMEIAKKFNPHYMDK